MILILRWLVGWAPDLYLKEVLSFRMKMYVPTYTPSILLVHIW